MSLLSVALGGALGALARYGLTGWIQDRAGWSFPWGTLGVNLMGCLLIGLALRALEGAALPPEARRFLAIGLLGSFTTFSTFAYEAVALLQEGQWTRAGSYVATSVVLGLAAVLVGLRGGSLLLGRG